MCSTDGGDLGMLVKCLCKCPITWSWRNDSQVKSTGYSSRGHEFISYCPPSGSQADLTTILNSLTPSSGVLGHWVCMSYRKKKMHYNSRGAVFLLLKSIFILKSNLFYMNLD